ncbi:alpha,alpha-trehalose-phosphate synthase [Schizosaccharomyces cryophilus OY26]|uniref:Alpha,alpha-trehalose-phosphate synthase n=1 Tax=Schizosaccharomyces cryophilus (strain OY26 / ATCC MYA-4695 / CBS 11777 / NBRC 106824 / NRRL Y48691) TaxID=653667 RepID=S9VZZ7_SCHCR|nr:alpha,alpha-trehalose-phosphate synthase [Schizosaccharomyces cryophilus OY26]EPY53268.1 alpha,alpha-trehalose-phosphate synthase [Schizosaccharomyces cryophilus OY26]
MGRILIANLFLPSTVGFSFDTVPRDALGSRFLQRDESKDWIEDAPLDENAILSEEEEDVEDSDDERGTVLSDLPEEVDSSSRPSSLHASNASMSKLRSHAGTPTGTGSPKLDDSLSNLQRLLKSRGRRHQALNDEEGLSLPPSRHQSPPPSNVLASYKRRSSSDRDMQSFARRASRSLSFSTGPGANLNSRRMTFDAEAWQKISYRILPNSYGNASFYNAVNAADRTGKFSDYVYIGTSGVPTDSLPDVVKKKIADDYRNGHKSIVVYPSDTDFVGHYNHYCKNILWPTFHYQIPDNPKSKAYEDHSWSNYVKVNQNIADAIIANYREGDMVWVNDYHLLLVPQIVRERIPSAKIGFFLHIPFPSSEVSRCLATRQEILRGMLGANILGFQIPEFAYHFLQTCSRLINIDIRKDGTVSLDGRKVEIVALPISIDPTALDKQLSSTQVQHWIRVLRDRFKGKHIILSHDKLDPICGLRSKLLSFEIFLHRYPEYRENTILLQIAPESLQDNSHLPLISDIVTRINSSYSNIASRHVPVILLRQKINIYQFLALMTISDALIDNSLREGISLTSHQFIYAQRERHRPLILSEFVGSSAILGHNAIIVNPWDYSNTANAFYSALSMSPGECEERSKIMCNLILRHDALSWAITFATLIKESWKEQQASDKNKLTFSADLILDPYRNAKKRLIFLYFEGTITSWGSQNQSVTSGLQRTINLLTNLTADPKNLVYIVSALGRQELDQLFQRVPRLGLVAENGCFTRSPPTSDTLPPSEQQIASLWKNEMKNVDLSWMKTVTEIFEYYAERTPGSYVEEKDASVVLHLREAEDSEFASWAAKECCESVNNFDIPCHATIQNDTVVCRSSKVSKRVAAEDIYKSYGADFDFIFSASNETDDDSVFRWITGFKHTGPKPPFTHTVYVGDHDYSNHSDSESSGVFGFLQAFEKVFT